MIVWKAVDEGTDDLLFRVIDGFTIVGVPIGRHTLNVVDAQSIEPERPMEPRHLV